MLGASARTGGTMTRGKDGAMTSGTAMKGGGYYSLATVGAKHVIDGATPLVLEALAAMAPERAKGLFTMADMGCADGGTSLAMVEASLRAVRKAAPERPIAMVYTDQPTNDYNALFQNVGTRLEAIGNLTVFASATSFYRQILPPGSLDLGFSATAMHWLAKKPCDIPDHVQAVGARGAALEAFAAEARTGWGAILASRAIELKRGGRLVLVNFCKDEAGNYLGWTGGVSMFDTFNRIWRDFLAEGAITADEYTRMTLPQYYNTLEEFSRPLKGPDGPAYGAGLRLEHIETRIVPCPFAADFKHHGDRARFASAYIPTLRSWTESTFHGALDADRSELERRALIERYYGTYEALVAAQPEGHGMDYVHAYMVIRKD
jgi:indole-3-acetate O-methyltransferase